jgi:hypothetical protein
MGRVHDSAISPLLLDALPDDSTAGGVDPRRRLVNEYDLRVADHRQGAAELALVAARKVSCQCLFESRQRKAMDEVL